jgi:hypothetical protein
MIFSVASSPASPVNRVVQRFFLFWRHGCSADRIRLPAKAKACDVRANAAFRISTLHRRCLYDVI